MDYFAHPLGCMPPTLVEIYGGDIEVSGMFPTASDISKSYHIHANPALFSRHEAQGCWAIQQMFAFCICWLSHITLLSAGFCSVLSFHETLPEFPAIISELKTPSPSTGIYILQTELKIKVFPSLFLWSEKSHNTFLHLSLTLFLCLVSFLPKASVFPFFFFCFHRYEKEIYNSAEVFTSAYYGEYFGPFTSFLTTTLTSLLNKLPQINEV